MNEIVQQTFHLTDDKFGNYVVQVCELFPSLYVFIWISNFWLSWYIGIFTSINSGTMLMIFEQNQATFSAVLWYYVAFVSGVLTFLFLNPFWTFYSMCWNTGSQKSVHPSFKSSQGKWSSWASKSLLLMSLRNVWLLEHLKNVIALLGKSFHLVKHFRFVLFLYCYKLVHFSIP